MKQPKVVSIAGFDPSAGAGILSDIKTFQHFKVYGFGIMSALTFQNELGITDIRWSTHKEIKKQIDGIFKLHTVTAVKIGIIENANTLLWLAEHLKTHNQHLKIVWDPVLKSSSGFDFWNTIDQQTLDKAVKLIDLITPNNAEYMQLWDKNSYSAHISNRTAILHKSASEEGNSIIDYLFWNQEKHCLISEKLRGYDKHGTGCILSSGITAGLASGLNIKQAYYKAKEFLNQYMLSSSSLLGMA